MSRLNVYLLDGTIPVFDPTQVRCRLPGVAIMSTLTGSLTGEDHDWSQVHTVDLLQGKDGRWVCSCTRDGRPFPPPPASVPRILSSGLSCWEVTTAEALKWCLDNHQEFPPELLSAATVAEVRAASSKRRDSRRRRALTLRCLIERLEKQLASLKPESPYRAYLNRQLASNRQELAGIESLLSATAPDHGTPSEGDVTGIEATHVVDIAENPTDRKQTSGPSPEKAGGSPDSLTPSVEQLSELAQAGRAFASLWMTTFCSFNGCLWREEERLAVAIERVADALLPFQGIDESAISGWSDGVWIALRDLPAELHRVARLVGLDPLIAPSDERERFRKDRGSVWDREIDEPFYDAAMSMARGFTLTKKDETILSWAREGRGRRYKPTMSPEEGEARLPTTYQAWWRTPRLGKIPFDHEQRTKLDEEVYPFSNGVEFLENDLRRVDRERRQAKIPPAETLPPETPFLDLDGQWKPISLVGSEERSLAGFAKGMWRPSVGGPAEPFDVIRTPSTVYLVRERLLGSGAIQYLRIRPKVAADWLSRGKHPLFADLKEFSVPVSVDTLADDSLLSPAEADTTAVTDQQGGGKSSLQVAPMTEDVRGLAADDNPVNDEAVDNGTDGGHSHGRRLDDLTATQKGASPE
jgi:hypothetical protein